MVVVARALNYLELRRHRWTRVLIAWQRSAFATPRASRRRWPGAAVLLVVVWPAGKVDRSQLTGQVR